jgi:hypothetical protein
MFRRTEQHTKPTAKIKLKRTLRNPKRKKIVPQHKSERELTELKRNVATQT